MIQVSEISVDNKSAIQKNYSLRTQIAQQNFQLALRKTYHLKPLVAHC